MSPCCPIAPSTRHYSSQPHFSQSQYIKIWFSIYTRRHFVWLCCGGITTNNVICHTFKLMGRRRGEETGGNNYLLRRVMVNIPSRCAVPRFMLMLMMLFGCIKCQFIKFSCFNIFTLM